MIGLFILGIILLLTITGVFFVNQYNTLLNEVTDFRLEKRKQRLEFTSKNLADSMKTKIHGVINNIFFQKEFLEGIYSGNVKIRD